MARIRARIPVHDYQPAAGTPDGVEELARSDPEFRRWRTRNVISHKVGGYACVTLSLKSTGAAPGDLSDAGMEAVAALAEDFGFGELRVSHEQNLILPDVRVADLPTVYRAARALGLAHPNIGLITNIIACPGGDYCSLANARSIPVAQALQERFDDLDYQYDIGELDLNISGCMNACGHHHVGHIGILGVDKHGEEFYQVSIGGSQSAPAALGRVIGPSLRQDEIPDVVESMIRRYLALRDSEFERFVDVVRRVGIEPFKETVYGDKARSEPSTA